MLHTLVEAEFEALGANNNDTQEGQDGESGDEASSSILHSLRKRICRDRERQIQVTIIAFSRFTIFIVLRFKLSFTRTPVLLLAQLLRLI